MEDMTQSPPLLSACRNARTESQPRVLFGYIADLLATNLPNPNPILQTSKAFTCISNVVYCTAQINQIHKKINFTTEIIRFNSYVAHME